MNDRRLVRAGLRGTSRFFMMSVSRCALSTTTA